MLPRMAASDPATARPAVDEIAPLFEPKSHAERSVFTAASLLREARRQRHLPERHMPSICILDPDGDLARHLREAGRARIDPAWACYHTTLSRFMLAGREVGIVPFTVGAPFAVLVAEELMASGCELLINLTSAGRIAATPGIASFLVIERALRDEGTSYHYVPAARWSHLRVDLREALAALHLPGGPPIVHGSSWTTDAPFRETAQDIERHRAAGVLAVEMEAAALYAFGHSTGHDVVCLAHLTNELGGEGDFEKGAADGAEDALCVLEAILTRLHEHSALLQPKAGAEKS
jgi:uridine phosphorylase